MTNLKTKTYKIIPQISGLDSVKITTSKDIEKFVRQFYSEDLLVYESFFICLLNAGNCIDGWVKISQGGTVGTVVDVKIITKYAIESLSAGVILVHNHPSGRTNASDEDKKITREIKTALNYFKINLLDHIILADDKYLSFADTGIL